MSELLTCISKRVSHVLTSKFPGTTQVVNAAIRLIGEEPKNVVETNPQLYMKLLDQLSDLALILVISFPDEDWVYEFLNALRNDVDLLKTLVKNRNKIVKYCNNQTADAVSKRLCSIEEALSENT